MTSDLARGAADGEANEKMDDGAFRPVDVGVAGAAAVVGDDDMLKMGACMLILDASSLLFELVLLLLADDDDADSDGGVVMKDMPPMPDELLVKLNVELSLGVLVGLLLVVAVVDDGMMLGRPPKLLMIE